MEPGHFELTYTLDILICGLFLGGSVFSVKTLSVLSSYLQPYYISLIQCIQTGPSSNPPVFFCEILLKCAAAGFLAGFICRNIFQWDYRDKNLNILTLGVTVASGIGIYAISQDGIYFSQISTQFWNTAVGNFFLRSQLGRIIILLGLTRGLGAIQDLPYTAYFFIFFICIFQVYSLAMTASPNLF